MSANQLLKEARAPRGGSLRLLQPGSIGSDTGDDVIFLGRDVTPAYRIPNGIGLKRPRDVDKSLWQGEAHLRIE